MISIKTFIFNAFQVNTYVLSDETKECVIVDAACYEPREKQKLAEFIASQGLKPVRLINTHGHVDHVLGWNFANAQWHLEPETQADEKLIISQAVVHGQMFGFEVEPLPNYSGNLNEAQQVTFGNSALQVFHVPGHSLGSVAFYSAADGFVITGDVLFHGSIGRTDLPGGNYDTLINSITTKLLTLPDDTLVFCGHGPSSTIGNEKKNNPFLQE